MCKCKCILHRSPCVCVSVSVFVCVCVCDEPKIVDTGFVPDVSSTTPLFFHATLIPYTSQGTPKD